MIFLKLFFVFFKIGAVIFGGGYAMIPLIQNEVTKQGWLTNAQFADIVTIAQLTPGPISLNTATYAGKITAGLPGALAASFGLIFPALLITSLVFHFLNKHLERSKHLQHIIKGIRSAAMGLIAIAVLFFLENSTIKRPLSLKFSLWPENIVWPALFIFLVTLFLAGRKKIPPLFCLLLSAILGIVFLGK